MRVILCQITSVKTKDKYAIAIKEQDFKFNKLPVQSNIRPNRIFTADKNIIIRKVASIKSKAVSAVMQKIFDILSQ